MPRGREGAPQDGAPEVAKAVQGRASVRGRVRVREGLRVSRRLQRRVRARTNVRLYARPDPKGVFQGLRLLWFNRRDGAPRGGLRIRPGRDRGGVLAAELVRAAARDQGRQETAAERRQDGGPRVRARARGGLGRRPGVDGARGVRREARVVAVLVVSTTRVDGRRRRNETTAQVAVARRRRGGAVARRAPRERVVAAAPERVVSSKVDAARVDQTSVLQDED